MVAYIGPIDIFVATTWSLFASGVLYVNHKHIDSCVGTSFIQTPKVDGRSARVVKARCNVRPDAKDTAPRDRVHRSRQRPAPQTRSRRPQRQQARPLHEADTLEAYFLVTY